jgi:hypothetical protein
MSATATLKSAIQTVEYAGGTPATWQLGGLIDGRVKVLLDTYTAVGSGEDAGSVITFAALPTGANVLAVFITSNYATSSLTFSVGDSASTTRYVTASAGPQSAAATNLNVVPGYVIGTNYTSATSQDNNIVVTTGGAALHSGSIYGIMVLYSFD